MALIDPFLKPFRALKRGLKSIKKPAHVIEAEKRLESPLVHASQEKPDYLETLASPTQALGIFEEFQIYLYALVDHARMLSPDLRIYREKGKTENQADYFFFKNLNQEGVLIERTPSGFVISIAKRILNRDLFVRSDSHWDKGLFLVNESGSDRFLIKSENFGETPYSLYAYSNLLGKKLGLSNVLLSRINESLENPNQVYN